MAPIDGLLKQWVLLQLEPVLIGLPLALLGARHLWLLPTVLSIVVGAMYLRIGSFVVVDLFVALITLIACMIVTLPVALLSAQTWAVLAFAVWWRAFAMFG